MREVIAGYQVKIARFRTGERFPVLLDGDGLPLSEPLSYLACKRHLAVNTLEGKARTLALVHGFIKAYGIDLRARVLEGRVLEYAEATALRDHVRRIGKRTEAIYTRRKCEDAKTRTKDTVEAHEWHRRRWCAAEYLEWWVNGLVHDLKLSSDDYKRVVGEVEKAKLLIVDGGRPAAKATPTALTPEQRSILLDAIRPGSETNPFPEAFQFRNFALIATYWETGLRRSEVLGLKHLDLSAPGVPPTLKLVRRPNDPDETRARTASVKTIPRQVPITPLLHAILGEYIARHRRLVEVELRAKGDKDGLRRFKSNPYIFVSTLGSALSVSSIHKVFETLRMSTTGLPIDLSPHVLRRTWNDMFSELSRKTGMGPREAELRELLMGWVPGSAQSVRYARQSTEREANCAILGLQQQWTTSWKSFHAS